MEKKSTSSTGSTELGDQAAVAGRSVTTVESSPASKANAVLKSGNSDDIRKQLVFGYALTAELHDKLKKSSKKHKESHVMHRALLGKMMQKYKLISKAREQIGLTQRGVNKVVKSCLGTGSILEYKRKKTERPVDGMVRAFSLLDFVILSK